MSAFGGVCVGEGVRLVDSITCVGGEASLKTNYLSPVTLTTLTAMS